MIKQLTALILVLAIANPFCCCFAKSSSSSEQELPSSCCHSNVDESSDSSSGKDAPLKSCPCKKPVVQADYMEVLTYGAEKLKPLMLLNEHPDMELTFIATPAIRLGFYMRPPPRERKLQIVHCVFRT